MSEASPLSPASDYSVALLSSFVRLGLRDIVLCPGSRSQGLALAAAELERVGAIRLHVRIDERVAGFLALGLAVETGRPAPIITTSGTATANLHPAVLEAHHSGVPMILLTADRPAELRGIRSNQTTVQPGMYGDTIRLAEDVDAPVGAAGEADAAAELARTALDAATGARSGAPGPVQLNLAFREPLSAKAPDLSALAAEGPGSFAEPVEAPEPAALRQAQGPGLAQGPTSIRPALILAPGPRTVVIAGHAAGAQAEEFARSAGWPLLAEVSSGARFGPNLVVAYRELLSDPQFGGLVERAVVFGHPTLSREVPALLVRSDVEVIVVAPTGEELYNPGHRARGVGSVAIDAAVTPPDDARAWLGRWVFTSRRILDEAAAPSADLAAPDVDASRSHQPAERIAFAKAELAAVRAPVTRRMLVDALWRFTWPHDRLVLGASRLIRDADGTVPGKKIRVHSNRGLAGIDGTISTAVGIALGLESETAEGAASGVTRVLLGDLTLLHDVGAMLFGAGESRPRLQVVVGNDGGGTIFDSLEVAGTAPAEALDRVMLTPQRVDFAALATAYGWQYASASTRGELDQALSAPVAGPSLIEVPLAR